MLHYPKMPDARNCPGGFCVAFEKLDGTNMHWDWHRDFGWHAFGTRRDVFNLLPEGIKAFTQRHAQLIDAPTIFLETLADDLERVFQTNPNYAHFEEIKVFTEFLGANSFAGNHEPDDPKRLVVFDVWLEDFGFVGPRAFVADFGPVPIPRVVFRGKFTGQLAEDVRNGKFDVPEGVVVKGGLGGSDVWMVKVKTLAYMERLKKIFKDGWDTYWE